MFCKWCYGGQPFGCIFSRTGKPRELASGNGQACCAGSSACLFGRSPKGLQTDDGGSLDPEKTALRGWRKRAKRYGKFVLASLLKHHLVEIPADLKVGKPAIHAFRIEVVKCRLKSFAYSARTNRTVRLTSKARQVCFAAHAGDPQNHPIWPTNCFSQKSLVFPLS